MESFLTENEENILKFLKEHNMNCDPDKWGDIHKEFKKVTKLSISKNDFEDAMLSLLNYRFKISLTYNNVTEEYGMFKIRKDP